jgi:hypothetical protein
MSRARLTAIVALALMAMDTLAEATARVETFRGKDAEVELSVLLAPTYSAIPSVRLDRCISRQRTVKPTHWREWQRVEGCSLTIAAADFPRLIANLGNSATHRTATSVKPSTPVPAVGVPFQVGEVYFLSPPEAWHRNDPLIYTDSTHTRVLVYAHFLVEE